MASSSEPAPAPGAARGFIPPRTGAETLLMRRVAELCHAAQSRGIPRYTGFLSDREQDLAQAAVNRAGAGFARFWGGWPGAERKVLCLEPEAAPRREPVALLRIAWAGGAAAPQHRDLLGAILGLGLERAAVGDILLSPAAAYAFVTADKADFIAGGLAAAGHCPVHTERCPGLPPEVMQPAGRELQTATVPALRADAVLGAMLHAPRAQAAQLIAAGRVQVGHLPLRTGHEQVFAGDIFTVSGVGRYRLQAIGGKSRKDRIFITYYQY